MIWPSGWSVIESIYLTVSLSDVHSIVLASHLLWDHMTIDQFKGFHWSIFLPLPAPPFLRGPCILCVNEMKPIFYIDQNKVGSYRNSQKQQDFLEHWFLSNFLRFAVLLLNNALTTTEGFLNYLHPSPMCSYITYNTYNTSPPLTAKAWPPLTKVSVKWSWFFFFYLSKLQSIKILFLYTLIWNLL